ncbi:hypothetical protein D9M73_229190 [compost metagenome]
MLHQQTAHLVTHGCAPTDITLAGPVQGLHGQRGGAFDGDRGNFAVPSRTQYG